ncbi:hypothetical protein GS528_04800 [Rhodococcus hoagii]|nr:hypothetical protein [Prescottella equi]
MTAITNIERERRQALFEQGLKECSKCLEALPIDRFRRRSDGWAGLRAECIGCQDAAAAAWRADHREEERVRVREWMQDHPGRWGAYDAQRRADDPLWNQLRDGSYRARRRGLPADEITTEELHQHWESRGISPDHDAYTGQPLEPGWHIDHAWPLSAAGSPGHVVSNLIPCNASTNTAKGRRSLIDFLADRAEATKEAAA